MTWPIIKRKKISFKSKNICLFTFPLSAVDQPVGFDVLLLHVVAGLDAVLCPFSY